MMSFIKLIKILLFGNNIIMFNISKLYDICLYIVSKAKLNTNILPKTIINDVVLYDSILPLGYSINIDDFTYISSKSCEFFNNGFFNTI